MLSNNNLINKSESKFESNDSVISLWWCGSLGLHPDIVDLLEKQWLNVYHLDRKWDNSLWLNNFAIQDYLNEIKTSIQFLVEQWKRVHLYANSFWWYLALKIIWEVNHSISSAVLIAPLINPIKSIDKLTTSKDDYYTRIMLSDWTYLIYDFPILNSNIEFLKSNGVELVLSSWIMIIWNKDEIIDYTEMDRIEWIDLSKHVISWAKHGTISSHSGTHNLIKDFYTRILK